MGLNYSNKTLTKTAQEKKFVGKVNKFKELQALSKTNRMFAFSPFYGQS